MTILKLLLFLAFDCLVQAACITVQGNEIVARDMLQVDRAFSKIDPAYVFSYAPPVGSQRTISLAELKQWAAKTRVELGLTEPVCFERPSFELSSAEILHQIKMLFAEKGTNPQIEVIEVCHCLVPQGSIKFSLNKVQPPPFDQPELPVMWPGEVITRSGAIYPIWARVRVLSMQKMIRTKEALRVKQVIELYQIEEVQVPTSPLRPAEVEKLESYVGKMSNQPIARGALLRPGYVSVPPTILPGSVVKVSVVNGGTQLILEARAVDTANVGDNVTLVNPSSLGKFHALVTGPGTARLLIAAK